MKLFYINRYGAKLMEVLYPVKHIVKPEFTGKVLIDGDLEDNCILFRFVFDKPEMVHPLFITVKALPLSSLERLSEEQGGQDERIYVYECNIPDLSNSVMKTNLLFPEFLIKEYKIEVIGIDSQVSCVIVDMEYKEMV
jgi:hypothetical protein